MTTSPRLGFTHIEPDETEPGEGVNEIATYLEAAAGIFNFLDRSLSAAPATPSQLDTYLVAATPAGGDLWEGETGNIAVWINTAWVFIAPVAGWIGWVDDEGGYIGYDGDSWEPLGLTLDDDEALTADSSSVAPTQHAVKSYVDAAVTALGGGVQDVPIMAPAMTPRTTSGAASGSVETTTNKVMVETLDFDQSTDEFAQFMVPMPKSWDEATITAKFIWTATTTGDAVWGIQAIALSNDDALDTAFGTAQTVTDAVTAANDVMHTAFTAAMTVGGSPAERDLVVFQVYRDANNGSDTLAADAKLLGVVLRITTDTGDDS